MPTIHPTAIIDPLAKLAENVVVGPYVIIEGAVTIGAGTIVQAHSVLKGQTKIGARCKIGPGAFVGLDPQHLKNDGKEGWLIVGDDCIIREAASLHRATKPGIENATRVGDRCFVMATAHVGHDCVVDEDVTLAHGSMLGGHVTVGSRAFLGGNSAVHQFCRIGRLVIVGGNEVMTYDVPPFAAARYGSLKGYNAIGCKRAGIARESIFGIRRAYRALSQNRMMPAAVAAMKEWETVPEVKEIIDFIAAAKRGILPRFSQLRGSSDDTAE